MDLNTKENTYLVALKREFDQSRALFLLIDADADPLRWTWIHWAKENGYISLQVHTNCYYQCHIARLTERGLGLLSWNDENISKIAKLS